MHGPAFVLFGPAHLGTIAAIVAAAVLVPLWVRRSGSERLANRLAVGMAAFVVVHEVVKIWVRVALYDMPLVQHLPLHLCGIAIFLTAIMLARRSYPAYELVYFWGFAGTLQAIVTPDIEYGFPHLFYLSYYVSHGAIIVGAAYATLVFEFRPTLRSIARVYLLTAIYAFVLIAPLNYLLDTNYLYLRGKPSSASILDYLGPWPWYLGSLLVLAWVLFFVTYLPFLILALIGKRRTDAAVAAS
jgi:hypothetical integral membrane protein (TIGR02206 family)